MKGPFLSALRRVPSRCRESAQSRLCLPTRSSVTIASGGSELPTFFLSASPSTNLLASRFKTTAKDWHEGNGNDSADGKSSHRLFEQQMRELESEREQIFGESVDAADVAGGGREPFDQYLKDEELGKMHEDRAALFGFTDEDRKAWSTAGGDKPHNHSVEFMEAVHAARASQFEMGSGEEEEEEPSGDSMRSTVQESHAGQHKSFTHLTAEGESVSMVDVGSKDVTKRVAKARSVVVFPPEVMEAFGLTGDKREELVGPKGPIFATAKIAGIMGAKRTSDLIPLCHPMPLDRVNVNISLQGNSAVVECECRVTHKTGVEMEALAGATIAALTIYDMVKAVSHRVRIEGTVLVSKKGGKRDVGHSNELS